MGTAAVCLVLVTTPRNLEVESPESHVLGVNPRFAYTFAVSIIISRIAQEINSTGAAVVKTMISFRVFLKLLQYIKCLKVNPNVDW